MNIHFFSDIINHPETGGQKYNEALLEGCALVNLRVIKHEGIRFSKFKTIRLFLNNFINAFIVLSASSNDIVIFDNGYFAHVFAAIILSRYIKKQKVIMVLFHYVHLENSAHRTKYYIIYWAEKLLSCSCNCLIVISLFCKNVFDNLSPQNKRVPYCIHHPFVSEKNDAVKKRCSYNKKTIFLQVGTIEKRKNIHNVIQAASKLNFPFEILFVGKTPGSSNEYAQQLIPLIDKLQLTDRIFLKGRASDKELSEYFEKSNVFILVSELEGYGMVYAEAMRYGLPIIGTIKGAVPELVQDGVNGILCDPENIDQITLAMNTMQDPDAWKRYSENNIKTAERFLDRNAFIQKTAHIFLTEILPLKV